MFKYYILDDSKKHQVFSFISSKPGYFEQIAYDNFKVINIINIYLLDTVICMMKIGKYNVLILIFKINTFIYLY